MAAPADPLSGLAESAALPAGARLSAGAASPAVAALSAGAASPAEALPAGPLPAGALPERAAVHWRPLADEGRLRREGRLWTLSTVAHVVPFVVTAGGLVALEPLAAPVSAVALAKAWIIPELYAARGANVVRRKRRAGPREERTALGLLGDLVGHEARELHGRTGLVLEPGGLGSWLLGDAGALLVRPGGRRVHCYCVRAADPELPSGDRIAHLLLALRADEEGFATVANLAFAGARWRVRRRIPREMRPALDVAARRARAER